MTCKEAPDFWSRDGGLTISLECLPEDVAESWRAIANCRSNPSIFASAAVSCFSSSTTHSASCGNFRIAHVALS